ncbi:MAG TPA: transporter substrate-binding domain-containing protein [Pseudonocardiaceae bacterium]|jgi:glutamate transport system substrate-binding protein
MADRGSLQPWPDLPPGQKTLRSTRAWTLLRTLRAHGWLRPRRLGCLFLILVLLLFVTLWVLSSAINGITASFRNDPPPITGDPLRPVAPTSLPRTSSPAADLISDGRLIVAVQNAPGLAERDPATGAYTGFDIALLDLISRDLGVDPAHISFKPVPAGISTGMLARHEADLALGGLEITPGSRNGDVAGPYLESPLRLAVPRVSRASSLESLGDGQVCAARDSTTAAALTGRLGDRLITRNSLSECANTLGSGVTAIAGNDIALRALSATKSGALRIVGAPLGTIEYGIALPPGEDALRERINTVLRTAIDDHTWTGLYQRYLGAAVPDPPAVR